MLCETTYKRSVGIFRGYISPIIFILGIIGNIFVIWIFLKKSLSCRFATYSIFLASTHIVILCVDTFLDDFFGRGLAYAMYGSCNTFGIKLDIRSNFSCKIMQYLPETMYTISSWIFVLFSIDRTLTICRPLQFYSSFYKCRTIIICLVIVFISFFVNIPSILSSGLRKITSPYNITITKCDILVTDEYVASRIELYSKVIISFVIPTFAVLLLNCIIIFKLYQIKSKRKLLMPTDRTKDGLEMSRVIGHLGISSLFLILVFPLVSIMIIRLYSGDNSRRPSTDKYYVEMLSDLSRLFSSLKDISYAADFYIYFLFLRNFKWYFFNNVTDLLVNLFPKCERFQLWKTYVNTHIYGYPSKYSAKVDAKKLDIKGQDNLAFDSELKTKY